MTKFPVAVNCACCALLASSSLAEQRFVHVPMLGYYAPGPTPAYVHREIVGRPPLRPARVLFGNSGRNEISVQIVDHRAVGERPTEIRVPPGESVEVTLDRHAGGVAIETHMSRGLYGEWIEDVRRVVIPPDFLYDVVVYENAVTSVYFDRTKNKGPIPDDVKRGLRSIGVFPVPRGDRLKDGARIDAYTEARSYDNPGAARAYPYPQK